MFTLLLPLLPLLVSAQNPTAAATTTTVQATHYVLEDRYSGNDFFSGWNFFTGADPTNGFVNYVNQSIAQANGLISTDGGATYIGVDYTSTLNASTSPGRQSVRISTEKYYNESLIIGDFQHMPSSTCGTWPAFWTLSQTVEWPAGGEIDIIEGVNTDTANQATLHTAPNCTIDGAAETGTLLTNDCAVADGNGCSVLDTRNDTYGDGFNAIQGGVYATQWTSEYIRIWFFPRSAIPADITAGTPDPSTWGEPMSNFQGSCDIDTHFFNHEIVFDTTFCGDWAGNVWSEFPTCAALAPTCTDYVAQNPAAFANAYWLVNYVAVYTQQAIPAVSTTLVSSTTSTWSHPTPSGYPNPGRVPVAAGQQGGWGQWHASAPARATTTALISQVPVTANATALTATSTRAWRWNN